MTQDKYTNGFISSQHTNISQSENERNLKITAVGDGMVGKTCILITYTSHEFPTEYIPTVFDNYSLVINVDGLPYNASLWDTAGQEDYERLRPLSYPNTNCFLLCYSISNRSSFDNIITKWHPELKKYCPDVPIILVATKCDLRTTPKEVITLSEGKRMSRKIRARKHMECSALHNKGLNEIFEEAVRCAVKKRNTDHHKACVLL
ncbi:ras-like GTP-binding protein RhoL [Planococcus citri]|uniref:ras-like GTP-binding protein RhoL n=1 Tax=Planococcus citri TaxID=170843 RepID=UPI0031FA0AF8